MTAPCQSICTPWATFADVCAPCNTYDFDTIVLDEALTAASEILYQLSGRQFPGSCQDTVRPTGAFNVWPLNRARWWHDQHWQSSLMPGWDAVCGCFRRVGCSYVPEIDLGTVPVTGIVEVLIDGAVVDPATYRVDDYRWLVRVPSPATPEGTNLGWPCCQNLTLPSTQPGTFEVTFTYGVMPPQSGVMAAAALGCQLALACANNDDCQLPQRVTSVVRQGVAMVVLDPYDFLDNGKTGMYQVDLFLRSVNPGGLHRAPEVLTPSMMSRVRRAGT